MLSGIMQKLTGKARGRDTMRGYGTIQTGFFSYITPKMIFTLAAPTLLVLFNLPLVEEYFLAGEALNFIILTVFLVGVVQATRNNFTVRRNAKYIKRMGDMIDAGKPSAEDVERLMVRLGSDGSLFDTNHMEGCIANIERFGHPNFTDSDARMIKGKLGQRMAEGRKGVFFLGGLLVMLGLIGTYIGLLHTVDKVGAVMQRMSNIGDASGDALSGFLGALAEPLQGMGLAFSASLFGISGSLLMQIYGNTCNHAQNEFVENVSRWIDDRIPKFSAADKDQKNKVFGRAASQDDLRTWLAGFVNLSVQSNRKLTQLIAVMLKSSQASIRSSRAIDAMMLSQKNSAGLIEAMSQSVVEFGRRSTDQGMVQMMADMGDLKSSAREISSAIPQLVQALNMMNAQNAQSQASVREGLVALGQNIRSQSADTSGLNATLSVLPETLAQLAQTQTLLLNRLENMQGGVPSQPSTASLDELGDMSDMSKLFGNMDAMGGGNIFEEMFGLSEDAPREPATEKGK